MIRRQVRAFRLISHNLHNRYTFGESSIRFSSLLSNSRSTSVRPQNMSASPTVTGAPTTTAHVASDSNSSRSRTCPSIALDSDGGAPTAEIVDNPCWGSPQHCDLSYLISLAFCQKEHAIIYESPNYIVLNKPPDLRMDGEYPATVHKLLTYWYPSPTLLELVRSTSKNPQTGIEMEHSERLLQAVSKLHKHNDLRDNELRPCHQLDYGTSGVLCQARTCQAAAKTSKIFAERNATKTYSAVVDGHLHIPSLRNDSLPSAENEKGTLQWPILTQAEVDSSLKAAEDAYRRRKKFSGNKKKNETFQGYQPAHTIYHKWKVYRKEQISPDGLSSNKKRKRSSLLTEEEWSDVWSCVKDIPQSTVDLDLDFKELCKKFPEMKGLFQKASTRHNDIVRRKALEKREAGDGNLNNNLSGELPPIFLVADEAESDKMHIYVYAPLAEVQNEFAMKVPPSVVDQCARTCASTRKSKLQLLSGTPDMDYKPSLTKCTILSRAYYQGRPVTKVHLFPKTGRRHQLRVHLALLGHPIMGDATYDASHSSSSRANEGMKEEDANGNVLRPSRRMCLHAHSLEMPLDEKNYPQIQNNESNENWKVTAPDPFAVSSKGELIIS